MTFLEFIGPEKALCYGLGLGFVIGIAFAIWTSSDGERENRTPVAEAVSSRKTGMKAAPPSLSVPGRGADVQQRASAEVAGVASGPSEAITEDERHAIAHARYQVERASPENPDCFFDYEVIRDLLRVIDRGRSNIFKVRRSPD